MTQYAGIDGYLEVSYVCVVDTEGKIVREAKVLSEPDALISWSAGRQVATERIGLEAGPLSQWLYASVSRAGLAVELLETRHVRAAFKTMPAKTDKKDARGITVAGSPPQRQPNPAIFRRLDNTAARVYVVTSRSILSADPCVPTNDPRPSEEAGFPYLPRRTPHTSPELH